MIWWKHLHDVRLHFPSLKRQSLMCLSQQNVGGICVEDRLLGFSAVVHAVRMGICSGRDRPLVRLNERRGYIRFRDFFSAVLNCAGCSRLGRWATPFMTVRCARRFDFASASLLALMCGKSNSPEMNSIG